MLQRRCIGCTEPIEWPKIACRPCWFRLPADIRRRVTSTKSTEYFPVTVEAVAWFRSNP
jgi:hypothetical protein